MEVGGRILDSTAEVVSFVTEELTVRGSYWMRALIITRRTLREYEVCSGALSRTDWTIDKDHTNISIMTYVFQARKSVACRAGYGGKRGIATHGLRIKQ